MEFGRTISSVPFGLDRNGRPIRSYRRRKEVKLASCLTYPLVDGPGIAMLVALPPFLAIMAMPVFDLLVAFKPGNALSPVALLIVPFTLPLACSFVLTVGYVLLFFGRVLSYSAIGDEDHPRWPKWDRVEIMDEIGRWLWAGLFGLAIGGIPAEVFWINCGDPDAIDWFIFLDLTILGVSYAQMALLAALLHETLLAANPVTVIRAISRIGWGYLGTCVVTALAFLTDVAAWYVVLLRSPNVMVGVLGLWGCWVLSLYLGMVVFRVLGVTYCKHAEALAWFRTGPRAK